LAELEYLPTYDALGDELLALLLPPVAGGSPGILDTVGAFVGGTITNEFGPIIDALGAELNEVLRQIWGIVQSALSLVFRYALRFQLAALGYLIPPYWNVVYSQRLASNNFTAGDMLATMWEAFLQASWTVWNAVAGWVRDRVVEFVQAAHDVTRAVVTWVKNVIVEFVQAAHSVTRGVITWIYDQLRSFVQAAHDVTRGVITWVYDQLKSFVQAAHDVTRTVITWAKDRIVDFVQAAHDVTRTVITWAKDQIIAAVNSVLTAVKDLGTWLWNNVGKPILDLLKQVADTLVAGGEAIFNTLVDALREVLIGPVDEIIDLVEQKLAIPGKLARAEYKDIYELLDAITDPPRSVMTGLSGVILFPFYIASIIGNLMGRLGEPLVLPAIQEQAKLTGATLPTLTNIWDAWNRGIFDDAIAIEYLQRTGFGYEALDAMKQLRYHIPSAADLTRMADKRVWSLQVPEKYGQYSELPEQVVGYMKQIGFPEEWTRNYWRAHWDLPSPNQVFEMLHRGFITEDDITQYLGLTDWLPFFRDKLLSISYNPLTRVDLRRVYKLGVIDEAQVNRGYRDLGYSPENADRLTQFTVRYYGSAQKTRLDEIKDLSAATIRQGYRRRVITREAALTILEEQGEAADVADFLLSLDDAQLAVNPLSDTGVPVKDESVSLIRQAYREEVYSYDEAVTHLEAIGVLGAEADVMLALEDAAAARDLRKAETALVRERYIAHELDAGGARTQLAAAGVGPREQSLLLTEWDVERQRGTRRLTVAEIFHALTAGLFDETAARAKMAVLGYNDADADIIFRLRGAA
jgi:hypothetical protein